MMSEENYPTTDPNKSHSILLIDLENCPDQVHHLQENLAAFSQVIICYARTGAKIPLDWLVPLSQTVVENKLKIFKMANGGKNSADFGICFFAGMLVQQMPVDTHFVISSNDHDLDHTVDLLISQGRSAERIGSVQHNDNPPKSKSGEENIAVAEPFKTYCQHLIKYSKNRPAKKASLLNSIKNKFKDTPGIAQEVFKLLTTQGAVKYADSKVIYNDQKIKEFAK